MRTVISISNLVSFKEQEIKRHYENGGVVEFEEFGGVWRAMDEMDRFEFDVWNYRIVKEVK